MLRASIDHEALDFVLNDCADIATVEIETGD
jgi:hypothetical protein